jgi:hypothetical protein
MKKLLICWIIFLAAVVAFSCWKIHQRNIDNAYGAWADQIAAERASK